MLYGDTMNDYRINGIVDIHDVDYNGILKTSAALKYMQSAAQAQLNSNGMSYDELKSMGRAFILSKIKLEIYKPLRAYQPYTAASFPCESRGYSFLRCYSLECDGETVARAASVWALVNINERSLVRVSDFDLNLPILPHNDITFGILRLPTDSLISVGEYTVGYGDTDQNRHMNNTRYPDMYSSFLDLDGKYVRSITINYNKEAPMGEKLSVMRTVCDGAYCFRTLCEDGRSNSEARIELCDI